MIMPCMNSTSSWESGGSAAFVDGGRVLLGLPGAPGCTTTGFDESFCCPDTAGNKPPTKARGARQRNEMVIFTTGLQDRPGTRRIAMFGMNEGGPVWIFDLLCHLPARQTAGRWQTGEAK